MPDKKSNTEKELKNAGFSIIELVFSMFFLTVIIFGVVNLQSSNLAMLSRQNNQILAHFYANQGVAVMEGFGFDQSLFESCETKCLKKLHFNAATQNYELLDLGDTKENISGTIFERFIEIDSGSFSDAYKATSIMEWEDATGAHRRTVIMDGLPVDINAHVEAKRIITKSES